MTSSAATMLSTYGISLNSLTPFADDVLQTLKRKRVTFKGLSPSHVEIGLSGLVRVRFYGHKDGRAQVGGVKFSCVFPEDNINLCNPAVVADLCAEGIAQMNAS